MATCKTGLLYYNVDTDRFQDLRIKRLKKDMGCDGYAVYEYILNEIYRVRGCFLVWDESTAFDVAEYWGLKETKVNEIVRYCCAVGLFSKALLSNGSVLTSPSIQSRYVNMCIKARRKEIIIPEEYNILPEECRKMLEECRKIPEEYRKVKNNKEKKSSTVVEDKEKPSSPSSRPATIDGEIEALKAEEVWLDQLQLLHHMDIGMLRQRLDEFRLHCKADGRDRHDSLTDAKQHFNSWLRIRTASQKQKSDGNRQGNSDAARRQRLEGYAAVAAKFRSERLDGTVAVGREPDGDVPR